MGFPILICRLATTQSGGETSVSETELRQRGLKGLFHPLCGADIFTLRRVLQRNGMPSERLGAALIALVVSTLRAPCALTEHLMVQAKRARHEPIEPPIFIIGHWRSGTTHLYNVMSKSPRFAYVSPFATALPWDFMLIGRLFAPLLKMALPENRFIDNIPVRADSPQEDEIGLANMSPISFYHALYFPQRFSDTFNAGIFFDGCSADEIAAWQRTLRYYYLKLCMTQPGKRLLIKNPVYTARIALLQQMWPEAKFIHIHRNPYNVFVSMQHFYQRLFAEFALDAFSHVDIDTHIIATYRRMMAHYAHDIANLRPHQFVELAFADFQRQPLQELERIYATLQLSGFGDDVSIFERYLESVRDYQKNSYAFPIAVRQRIGQELQPFIERWSYAPPAGAR